MNTDLNSINIPQIDKCDPEKLSNFQIQTGLRAGLVRPEEAWAYQNWDQVSAGLGSLLDGIGNSIGSFFDRVDASIDLFD